MMPVLADGRLVVERQFRYPLQPRVHRISGRQARSGRDAARHRAARADRGDRLRGRATGRRWAPCIRWSPTRPRRSTSSSPRTSRTSARRLDDGEFLEIVTLSIDEMLRALDRGRDHRRQDGRGAADGRTPAGGGDDRAPAADPRAGAGRRLSATRWSRPRVAPAWRAGCATAATARSRPGWRVKPTRSTS